MHSVAETVEAHHVNPSMARRGVHPSDKKRQNVFSQTLQTSSLFFKKKMGFCLRTMTKNIRFIMV